MIDVIVGMIPRRNGQKRSHEKHGITPSPSELTDRTCCLDSPLPTMYSLLTQGVRAAAHHLLPHLISTASSLASVSGYLSHQCASSTFRHAEATYLLHSFMHAVMVRLCRLLAISSTFTSALVFRRVDTHIHALPPGYIEAVEAAGGDPSGFPTPEWSVDAAIASMNQVNTDIGEPKRIRELNYLGLHD